MKRATILALAASALAACAAPPPPPPPPAPAPAPAPQPPPPTLAEATHGTAAEFALALREAIRDRDFNALRGVMAPDFSSGFLGPSNPDIAFAAWRSENYRSLDEAVLLLDGGLVPLGEDLLVAPAAFRTQSGYRGLRMGIRRGANGAWAWVFLVRGEG